MGNKAAKYGATSPPSHNILPNLIYLEQRMSEGSLLISEYATASRSTHFMQVAFDFPQTSLLDRVAYSPFGIFNIFQAHQANWHLLNKALMCLI